jgi:hypothetical protein
MPRAERTAGRQKQEVGTGLADRASRELSALAERLAAIKRARPWWRRLVD